MNHRNTEIHREDHLTERSLVETGFAPIQKNLCDTLCASVPLWFSETTLNKGRLK
jgi:hypothetical protein